MGICSSCESTSVATAMLILEDGKLQEFRYPVKVSLLLQKNPTCFICNSDDMGFGDFLSEVNADDELQPGQLYFSLPLSRLKYPLQAEEMAALAVKASSAIGKSHGNKSSCRSNRTVAPELLRKREDGGASHLDGGASEDCGMVLAKKKRPGSGRGSKVQAKLSAIAE